MVLCACRLLTPCRTRFRPPHILILGRAIRRRARGARPTIGAIRRTWGGISSAAYSHPRVRAIRRRVRRPRPTVGAIQRTWGDGDKISSATYSHHRVAGRFDGASGGRGLPLGRFSGHGGGGKRFRPQHILIIGWGRFGGARGARALLLGRFPRAPRTG